MFGSKGLLGLDIGTSSIKLVKMSKKKKSWSINSFGMVPTPEKCFENGEIVEPEYLGTVISQLVKESKIKDKNAALGLSGSGVIVKTITIPKIDKKLIAEQIRWEAEQYIPYDINEVNLDYEILPEKNGDSSTMDILLVAAVHDMIFKTSDVVTQSKLRPKVFDVDAFALANCFHANYGEHNAGAIGLINVGASVSNFVVVESGRVIFSRDLPVGGNFYTNELAAAMEINFTEAEAMKLAYASNKQVPEQAEHIVNNSHEVYLEELATALDFFMNTNQNSEVGKLYLAGGGSLMPGLDVRLSQVADCELLDPFIKVKPSGKGFSNQYLQEIKSFSAIAIGLAMRESGDS